MADHKLDLDDWFAVVVAALVSGVGGAMAWFNSSKRKMHERIDLLESNMREWDDRHADHNTQLAVLTTCQSNTVKQLEQISESTLEINRDVKALAERITQIVIAVQAKH